MKDILLNDGNKIPAIGFGTYKAADNDGAESIISALQNGYRLIDTAAKYGNEKEVGQGIRSSGVPREEIFLATKVWREELGYENTHRALELSLKNLGEDYVDLYLIHWPANARNYKNWQKTNAETWRAMEDLQREGKTKSIGVSNFWEEHLEELAKTAYVTPAVNQIEFHPGYWQPEVKKYCDENGIVVQAWSPLARGRVFSNETLNEIAVRHSRSVSQICMRWIVQHGAIPIPKASTEEKMRDNIDIFNFELSSEEMTRINELPEMGFSGELPALWPERLPLKD